MAESALIVVVPEAELLVGGLRERFDASARLGVPAHITVLYPFMPPEQIDEAVIEAIRLALAGVHSFRFSLAQVDRFAATAYLKPEPDAPFIALTEALARRFPKYPPYGGAYDAVTPHLTAAYGSSHDADFAVASLAQGITEHGPIHASCHALTLMENSTGRWKNMHVFPFNEREAPRI